KDHAPRINCRLGRVSSVRALPVLPPRRNFLTSSSQSQSKRDGRPNPAGCRRGGDDRSIGRWRAAVLIGRFLRGFNGDATLHPCPLSQPSIRLAEIELRTSFENTERGVMNRRHFGLSVAAAVLLAQQLREAVAQAAGRSPSSADTDSASRMRDAATAFLESLDEAARKAVSFPLEADQRTSWSNLPVALVPRVGITVGALDAQSRRRFHDLLRASTSSQGYHKIAAIMRHDDVLRTAELEYLQQNPPRPRAGRNAIESMGSANYWIAIFGEPARSEAWAWLLTGHHLGATFTCANGRVMAAPLFLGAQPLED